MRKLILSLVFLLTCSLRVSAQSTTVSGQVTDAGGQSWNNGTFTATFVPNPQYPTGPYTWTGGTLNQVITGSLSGTGSYSVSLPSNSAISPQGSQWKIQFSPNATSTPFVTANTTITGATQTLDATPPAISINLQNPPGPFTTAYADGEIATPIPLGGQYFNVTSLVTRVWNGSAWATQGSGAGGTPGAPVNSVQFNNAGSFGGDSRFTFNSATGQVSIATASDFLPPNVTSTSHTADGNFVFNSVDGAYEGTVGLGHVGMLFAGFSTAPVSGNCIKGGGFSTPSALSDAGAPCFSNPTNVALTFNGASSGSASIGAATIAGTPNQINLPTTTGAANNLLETDGANPQQTSWTTGLTWNPATRSLIAAGNTGSTSGFTAGSNAISVSGSAASNAFSVTAFAAGGSGTIGADQAVLLESVNSQIRLGDVGTGNTTVLRFLGNTSGNADVQVAAAAGTPNPIQLPTTTGTSGQVLSTNGANPQQLSWITPAAGTVTSVSFTGGLISLATPTTTPAFTVAGTSGGIPFFDSASTWNTSAALPSGNFVLGGGAGSAPTATFSIIPVANGGTGLASGTSGGIPAYTGTTTIASSALLTANSPVLGGGAGGAPKTATFLTTDGAATLTVGVAAGGNGVLALSGNTSGTATFTAPATAGTRTNPVTSSNAVGIPDGLVGTPGLCFTASTSCGTGIFRDSGGFIEFPILGSSSFTAGSSGAIAGFGKNYNFFSNVGVQDTGISRDAADVIDFGNGTNVNTTARLKASAYMSVGTKFTISGCSAGTTVGGGSAGKFSSGTTGTCTVTITMGDSATAPNGWSCHADDRTTPADIITQTSDTTTTAVLSGTTVSGDVISFLCEGY